MVYEIDKLPQVIDIGYVGEKNFRSVQFDLTSWMEIMPEGVPSVVFIRPGETEDDAYVVATTFEENILTWTVVDSDVAKDGTGIAQIFLEQLNGPEVEERGKSAMVAIRVNESIGEPTGEVPAPQVAWLEQMTELKTQTIGAKIDAENAQIGAEAAQTAAESARDISIDAKDDAEGAKGDAEAAQTAAEAAQTAAEDAQEAAEAARDQIYAMSATATGLPAGSDPTASYSEGVLSLGIPKGDTGEQGEKGETGAGVPTGGTTGQFLMKSTNDDYATEWGTPPDPTGKADKVESATAGNFAGLDATGNLTDSGSKASDFLTQHQDISGKADKVSSPTNGDFAGLDSNGNLTDSGKSSSSFVASNQGSQNAGKALGIANDGSVTPVPFSGEDFTGATASTAGTHGYVPAPSAGYQAFFLKGDGTWADPPGGKLIVVDLDTVTNTSGSYTHTTTISGVTSEMKPVVLELGNPSAFKSGISITTGTNSVTLTCSSVSGTSTVKVSMLFVATANSVTSSEFDVLAGRIGTLSSLTTTAKTDTVSAINEVNANVGTLSSLHTTAKTSLVAATNELSDQIASYRKGNIELNGVFPSVAGYSQCIAVVPFRNADKATFSITSCKAYNGTTQEDISDLTIIARTEDYLTVSTRNLSALGCYFYFMATVT